MKPPTNVSAQNERVAEGIAEVTTQFRSRSAFFPSALYDFLVARDVDPALSVMINASRDEQGINPIVGFLLTQTGRFYDFDLDCDARGTNVVEINEWTDVTDNQNMALSNPGFGKNLGIIAVDVQRRLEPSADVGRD